MRVLCCKLTWSKALEFWVLWLLNYPLGRSQTSVYQSWIAKQAFTSCVTHVLFVVARSIHVAEKSLRELHTGQFDIPVVNLQQPPQKWMIRPVDMAPVSRLKNVISNNLDHEKMTEPPMAIAPVEKVDFQLGNIKSYKLPSGGRCASTNGLESSPWRNKRSKVDNTKM